MVASEDVNHGKPEPEVFLKAAARIELEPGRCIVIEDTVHGIQAGLAGGMWTVGVATSHPGPVLEEAGAHRVVRRLNQLSLNDLRGLVETG
jgi:beta-phosphoglucomutase-like phosphatase (HAD superfamily)